MIELQLISNRLLNTVNVKLPASKSISNRLLIINKIAQSDIAIENWKTFNYESDQQVVENLDSDVDAALAADGYDMAGPEAGGFVETVKTLTESVKRFFGGFFNRQ